MARDTLGTFEYTVLAVLQRWPLDAYGVKIVARIRESTGRRVSPGALYTTLDRLEQKGFASSWWGDASRERGGRRKRYYKLEAPGVEAMQRASAVFSTLGRWIPAGALS